VSISEQAKAKRELAVRARRLAQGLSPADAKIIEHHADQLDREAAELERQAATAGPVAPPSRTVTQMQTQQQQQEADPKPKDESNKS